MGVLCRIGKMTVNMRYFDTKQHHRRFEMIVQNGMCYADDRAPVLKIVAAKSCGGHELEVLFNNGDRRIFDGRKLLVGEVFAPLADEKTFNDYRLDYETLTWLDGDVDVAPEFVYENSKSLAIAR